MKTLLKNIIDIYVWVECIQNIPKTIYSLFFTLFQPLYFKVMWRLLPNACWQGWVFCMLSLPRCPIFCQCTGGVIPAAGILSKPHQGNSRVFQTGWLCKTYCTGRWDSQLDTILFHAVGGNHQPRSFLPLTLLFSNSLCHALYLRKKQTTTTKTKHTLDVLMLIPVWSGRRVLMMCWWWDHRQIGVRFGQQWHCSPVLLVYSSIRG